MVKRTYSYLRHPFQYPEWGELILAFMGLCQFIFATVVFDSLGERRSYDLTIFLSPEAWSVAGLLLFVMHMGALRGKENAWGDRARIIAASSSLAFWTHFILSMSINSLLFGVSFPGTLVPSICAPMLGSAVLYRLWRHY